MSSYSLNKCFKRLQETYHHPTDANIRSRFKEGTTCVKLNKMKFAKSINWFNIILTLAEYFRTEHLNSKLLGEM